MAKEPKEKKSIFKRWWFWVIVVVIIIVIAVNSGDDEDSKSNTGSDKPAETDIETAAPEKTKAPQAEGSGDLGDYHVEIKGAALAQDYDGNPAIVVTYSWTNNSEETTSAMSSLMEKAFQDGVQLESAIIGDDSVCDSESSMKEIRPGTTLDVQQAYILTSDTSTVEFEISEFISFSDDVITKNFDPSSLS